MKLKYNVDESGKYFLCNNTKTNITEYIPILLHISKYEFEKLIRQNGAFKHINGKFYFYKKEDIINAINQLKRLHR